MSERLLFFFLKGLQILKDLVIIMENAVTLALLMKDPHQPFTVRAVNDVLIAVQPDIFFFQMWKQFVQLAVKIFPVSLPQRQAHAEANDAKDVRLSAQIQYARNIFFRVVDER